MKTTTAALAILALLFLFLPTANAVTFDWATVGDAGNAEDIHGDGYGSVDHAYRISQHEVTAGQYTEFLNAVAASDPNDLYNTGMWTSTYGCKIEQLGSDGSYSYQVAADRENRPVNFVSYFDAMRFTNWLENGQGSGGTESGVYTIGSGIDEVRNPNATYFIPSEDEWYKAAYYKGGGTNAGYWDYPTQSDTSPGFVNNSGNLSGTGAPFAEGGTDPGGYATYDGDGGTDGIGSPYWMTEVGEWENSESPYGTFDQGGNVWEWNEALISGSFRGLRGGSFGYYSLAYLHAANRYYLSDLPTSEYYYVGFRVASIPEPASATLMLCMGAGVLMLRRCRM